MTNKTEEEIWKVYPDYPFVEVSNLGNVRTKDRYVPGRNGSKRLIKGRVLKQHLNKGRYMYVEFHTNGKVVSLRVHRMVAICFIPNPNNYPEVNHKDNDRTNNVVSNLEWCDRQYNQDYRNNFGSSPAQVQGTPVIAVNSETSEVLWFESQHEAARQLKVRQSSICKVLKGQYGQTGGYWLTYADENTVEKVRAKFGDEIAKKVEDLMKGD